MVFFSYIEYIELCKLLGYKGLNIIIIGLLLVIVLYFNVIYVIFRIWNILIIFNRIKNLVM